MYIYFRNNVKHKNLLLSIKDKELEKEQLLRAQREIKMNELKNSILEKNSFINELKERKPEIVLDNDFSENMIDNLVNKRSWEKFMIEFELLYPSMLDGLKKEYGSLTKNDLRLISMLKLNLTGKEIAGLLNIAEESVRRSKNRLKNKLNLNDDDSVYDFVKAL